MQQFENVTVIKKANVYFEGKVTSRTILFSNGEKKTLGILMPGDYDFGTEEKEIMEILDGELLVQLPGNPEWIEIKGGQSFEVPEKSRFKLNVKKLSDYCCSYIKE
ncbi:pyrimidine/purine nucleoside phosphorylase [Leptospira sarikeiensis]|uniref:Pyrimidine/purine nucleoside phosphorylase n=1 Tax=Leptospira sarikeiensis TaxID=2484943 RepID=A0A4R9KBQ2_9LEPT|nr:pyrimidine/purine nucleoside phosphorylase [Leptospira sarikeiensis]TGL63295.1 pyrimidine/purine nucleoside phosphorylase [Leptospira sarikeiensis]